MSRNSKIVGVMLLTTKRGTCGSHKMSDFAHYVEVEQWSVNNVLLRRNLKLGCPFYPHKSYPCAPLNFKLLGGYQVVYQGNLYALVGDARHLYKLYNEFKVGGKYHGCVTK